jgi:hypothetical protein
VGDADPIATSASVTPVAGRGTGGLALGRLPASREAGQNRPASRRLPGPFQAIANAFGPAGREGSTSRRCVVKIAFE